MFLVIFGGAWAIPSYVLEGSFLAVTRGHVLRNEPVPSAKHVLSLLALLWPEACGFCLSLELCLL